MSKIATAAGSDSTASRPAETSLAKHPRHRTVAPHCAGNVAAGPGTAAKVPRNWVYSLSAPARQVLRCLAKEQAREVGTNSVSSLFLHLSWQGGYCSIWNREKAAWLSSRSLLPRETIVLRIAGRPPHRSTGRRTLVLSGRKDLLCRRHYHANGHGDIGRNPRGPGQTGLGINAEDNDVSAVLVGGQQIMSARVEGEVPR